MSGPVVVRQVHGDKTVLRSSQEVNMCIEVQVKGLHSRACTEDHYSSSIAQAGTEGAGLRLTGAPGPMSRGLQGVPG